MSLPPTIRQLVDRVEALEDQHDPRTVVIVPTAVDTVGADADFVIVTGVPEVDPEFAPAQRAYELRESDPVVVDRSAVVEESLNRPRGVRHALGDVLTWWKPRWP